MWLPHVPDGVGGTVWQSIRGYCENYTFSTTCSSRKENNFATKRLGLWHLLEFFIYDTILAFHHRPFVSQGGSDDAFAHMGNYVHSEGFLKGKTSMRDESQYVIKPLCQLLRYEMVLMLERIRLCYILAQNCDVTRPSDWGTITKDHLDLLESTRYKKYHQHVGTPIHKLYVREKYLRKWVCDGKKVPSLMGDTSHLLNHKLLAEYYMKRIGKNGELTQVVANAAKARRNRKKLICVKYYCEHCQRSWWHHIFLPLPAEKPTSPAEKARLLSLGIKGELIDVRGDGNCLYYCMLNFLVETGFLNSFWKKEDNPLMYIRKYLHGAGKTLKDSYWTFYQGPMNLMRDFSGCITRVSIILTTNSC